MDVGNLSRNIATVPVEWQGENADVKYKPGLLTPKRIDSMVDDDYGLQRFIAEVVVEWDVTERVTKSAKPTMFPVEFERLKELPTPFLRAVMRAMLSDGSDMGEAESNSSDT